MRANENVVQEYALLHEKILKFKKDLECCNRKFDEILDKENSNDWELEKLFQEAERIKKEIKHCEKKKANIAIRYADAVLLQTIS